MQIETQISIAYCGGRQLQQALLFKLNETIFILHKYIIWFNCICHINVVINGLSVGF